MSSGRLSLAKIVIEGFRGIAERTIDLEGKSLLLFGGTGKGKTSILRAIEWCLFDELPFIRSETGIHEDPVINDFSSKGKCVVELTLRDQDGRMIQIIREKDKKKGIKGKSGISVYIDGNPVKHAEEELNRILGLSLIEFYSRVFLHQEAIRNLIEDSAERTNVINIFLGLDALETLITSIPTDQRMQKLMESLGVEINKLKSDVTKIEQTLEERRKRKNDVENFLIGRGLSPTTLNLQGVASSFKDCKSQLSQLADNLKFEFKIFEDFTSLDKARKSVEELISN